MYDKRLEFSWWEDNKEMTVINWGVWYCTFGTSGKKKESKSLECRLMKKQKQFKIAERQNIAS